MIVPLDRKENYRSKLDEIVYYVKDMNEEELVKLAKDVMQNKNDYFMRLELEKLMKFELWDFRSVA